MGCSCVHEMRSETMSEDVVHSFEVTLGFASREAVSFAADVKVFSPAGFLSAQQLSHTLFSQNLNSQDLERAESPVARLYGQCLVGKKYDARKLTTLAVLLSAGTPEKKGEILFDLYQSSGLLSDGEVKVALQDLCEVALIYLPAYAASELELRKDSESLRKLSNYQRKLEHAKQSTINKLKSVVLGDKSALSLAEFISTEGLKTICSAREIRRHAVVVSHDMRR